MKWKRISVECYSGYKCNERPMAFTIENTRHEVTEILDRWYEGGSGGGSQTLDYFKVRTSKGTEFLLRYNSLFDAWAVLK